MFQTFKMNTFFFLQFHKLILHIYKIIMPLKLYRKNLKDCLQLNQIAFISWLPHAWHERPWTWKKNAKVIKSRNMLIISLFIIAPLENIYSLLLFIWAFLNYTVFNQLAPKTISIDIIKCMFKIIKCTFKHIHKCL